MTTKFFEEFRLRSKGEFDMLKFNSAVYYKEQRELVVKFIISAFEVKDFDDECKAKVQKIIEDMFSGVKVSVQYIRTYADASVVKNKVCEFFNRTNQMIFRRITDDSLKISIGEKDIEVKLIFDTPTYKMLMAGDAVDALTDYLDRSFNYEIDVLTEEIVQNADEIISSEDVHIDTTTLAVESGLRLVDAHVGDKIYSRGKMDGISQLPNYIADVSGACDNIVLCGKISNIDKRSYKNKKYNPNDAKSGPETLPMVKFYLDDTTAKMECVCFPNKDEDAKKIVDLKEQSSVVCVGKVSWSQFSNSWSYMVSAIFGGDINFDSIQLAPKKAEPAEYKTVFPQEYVDTSQKSLLDVDDEHIPYFDDKTFVIFDLETTGKMTDTAEVIEIAGIKVVNGKPTQTFQTLVKPLGTISEEIEALTHINNNMVVDAPNIESVLPDFFKFTRGGCILVGHNIAGYDFPIIKRDADKLGYNFDNDLTDTLLLARKYLTELPNFKLETISKHFGISHENAHRAMSDVLATFEALKIIAKRM